METSVEYLRQYSEENVRTFRTKLVEDLTFRRVLGKTCYKLFLLLVREANCNRYVDISIKYICEKLSIKPHTASYNISKLVNLEILGAGVKRKNKTSRRQLFATSESGGLWRVPESTHKVIFAFPLHGGKRVKGKREGVGGGLTGRDLPGLCSLDTAHAIASCSVGDCRAPGDICSSVSCQDLHLKLSRPDLPSYYINNSYKSYKDSSFLKERRRETSFKHKSNILNMNENIKQSAGSSFFEEKQTPPPMAWDGKDLPPNPSNEVVSMARLPSPPEITEDMTDLEKVQMLVNAYKGAVKSRYGKSDYSMRGDLGTHRNYKALLSSANTLMEKGVAPAIWVMWKFDQSISFWENVDQDPELAEKHKGMKRPKKYSPIYIVFSKKSIVKQAGWCRSESVKYQDGRTYFSPSHKKVTVLWKKMEIDLRTECPLTDKDREAIVQKTFTKDSYNRLVASAIEENKNKQDKWNYLSKSGAFIW